MTTVAAISEAPADADPTLLVECRSDRQTQLPPDKVCDYAAGVMIANMMAPDADEAIAAFIEKRAPNWRGH